MSMTCALMSSRPSSNTANRPTGPAPMMMASVSMGVPAGPLGGAAPSAGMVELALVGGGQTPWHDLRAHRDPLRKGVCPPPLLLLAGAGLQVVAHRAIGIAGIREHL